MRLHLSCPPTDAGSEVGALLTEAVACIGCTEADNDVDGVVLACDLPGEALTADVELSWWMESVEQPLVAALESLLDARRRLRPGEGSIVVVLPTIGIAGASELVALTTLVEGVRAMAKSAARQWAAEGVRINQLLLPLAVMRASMEPLTAHLPPTAAHLPNAHAVGAMIRALVQAPDSMIGATVVLDGGAVMAP